MRCQAPKRLNNEKWKKGSIHGPYTHPWGCEWIWIAVTSKGMPLASNPLVSVHGYLK